MDTSLTQSVLWDIEPAQIDTLPKEFLLRRIISYGTVSLLFQAIAHYGYGVVAQEFFHLSSTAMDKRRHHYLQQFVFNTPMA